MMINPKRRRIFVIAMAVVLFLAFVLSALAPLLSS